jgi:hypothetical protein
MKPTLWQRLKSGVGTLLRWTGDYQARLVLTLFYLLLLAPIALLFRLFSGRTDGGPVAADSYWLPYAPASGTLDEAKKQS